MSVCSNIEHVAQMRGLSIKELSRRIGVPYTTLYNMIRRDGDRFDISLLDRIARVLDVSTGTLLSSAEPTHFQILNDCYVDRPSTTKAATDTYLNRKEEGSDSAEKNDCYPFATSDKRSASLRYFDQLNDLGQKVAVQILLAIIANKFDGDLRRQLIFLLRHSNDKVVYNFNNALINISYLADFNDQHVNSSFTDLMNSLDSEMR